MSDFKGQSPWGTPPPGGNGDGGFRRGPTPPNIDEIVKSNIFTKKVTIRNLKKYLNKVLFTHMIEIQVF